MAARQGFIKLIVILIITLIVLGYFGINIKAIFQKESVRDNLSYSWQITRDTWNKYLLRPAQYAWGIFYNLLWRSFVDNAEKIKQGETPTLLENQPN